MGAALQQDHSTTIPGDAAALNLGQAIDLAERLSGEGRIAEAIELYRRWLAVADSANKHFARHNLASLLTQRGEAEAAIDLYHEALHEQPDFAIARVNLGCLLQGRGLLDEGLAQWRQALATLEASTKPADRDTLLVVLNNLGRVYENNKRHAEAEAMYARSLAVDPSQNGVIYHWVRQRQCRCAWPIYAELPGISRERMIEATSALAMLSISDDPELQLQAARRSVASMINATTLRLAPADGYRHPRLRVGYLSSNFGEHAVSLLTAELYELHDRSQFEVWGFCWSPEDGSPMRERVRQAFEHFETIGQLDDRQAAERIRAAEIDLLIDLQGLTGGARPNILALRPAPVQIAYLGHPGTSGMDCIDYVLCDRYVLPEASARYFVEKPLYLPDCFQVNDRKRAIGVPPSREQCGLPADGLVLCAFNHNHKFTPEWFALWMRILRECPGSVLWLLADNDSARENLLAAAAEHGVGPQRLVFAERTSKQQYLARLTLADLFLDCFPFNGGTTASDALWVGLPVLTCSGRSFASRMAGSLLQAIGLPELIAATPEQYVALAVALAHEPQRLAQLRGRLAENRDRTPLFDTPRLVRALEDQYRRVAIRGDVPAKLRLVVYTVLVGDKEALCDPRADLPADAASDLDIEFVCITDRPERSSPTWQCRAIELSHLPAEKLSRRPKAMPHEYLLDCDYSLYIDNTVSFRRLPQRADLEPLEDALLRVYAHPSRRHPGEEAEAVAVLGYENLAVLAEQMDFYRGQLELESLAPLSAGTMILRRHHHPQVKRFGQLWWEQILAFSKRDQLSLDYAARCAGIRPSHFRGSKVDNDLMVWMRNPAQTRVKAHFDPQRYAWIHRDDPAAVRAPRAHFLAHGAQDREIYHRRHDLFDYACYKLGCSLGSRVSPRRRVTEFVAHALAPWQSGGGRQLVVRIANEGAPLGYSHEELMACAQSLTALLPTLQAQVLEQAAAELDQAALHASAQVPAFDAVSVLGCAPAQLPSACQRLFGLANPQRGVLLLLCDGPLSVTAIEQARDYIGRRVGHACEALVAASHHDGSSAAIANSALAFRWGLGAAMQVGGPAPGME